MQHTATELAEAEKVVITLTLISCSEQTPTLEKAIPGMVAAAVGMLAPIMEDPDVLSVDLFTITVHENNKEATVVLPEPLAPFLLRRPIAFTFMEASYKFSIEKATAQTSYKGKQEQSFLWGTLCPGAQETASFATMRQTLQDALEPIGLVLKQGVDGFNQKKRKDHQTGMHYMTKNWAVNFTYAKSDWADRHKMKSARHITLPSGRMMDFYFGQGFCNEWAICKDCSGTISQPTRDWESQSDHGPRTCVCPDKRMGDTSAPQQQKRHRGPPRKAPAITLLDPAKPI
jgi:hypothetical protein